MSYEEYTWERYYEDLYHRQKKVNNALAVQIGEVTAKTGEMDVQLNRITGSVFWKALKPARKLVGKVRGNKTEPVDMPTVSADTSPEALSPRDRSIYESRLWKYEDYYTSWMDHDPVETEYREYPETDPLQVSAAGFHIVHPADCAGYESPVTKAGEAGWLIFETDAGRLARGFVRRLSEYLSETSEAVIVYPDEDCFYEYNGRTFRLEPYFKPDWSPDTLDSFFYFGHIVIIRTDAVREATWLGATDPYMNIYDLVLQIADRYGRHYDESHIVHIPEVLFHRDVNGPADSVRAKIAAGNGPEGADPEIDDIHNDSYILWREVSSTLKHDLECGGIVWGHTAEYDEIKLKSLRRRGLNAEFITGQDGRTRHIHYLPKASGGTDPDDGYIYPRVSALILTKDHPDILSALLTSFIERTDYDNYEFIVVDNGSDEKNRALYEDITEKIRKTHDCRYVYSQQEFNFSALCNLAASYAGGDLLLFMNDDIEVVQKDWLKLMTGYASLPHAGSVGARLLYAGTELIQHVGVTSMEIGPSHKLVMYPDDRSYYYGRNVFQYDMLGVTAACMMIDRHKFEEVGRFDESFPVAYNDVELTMRIAAAGYVNIQCNSALLYHHESLTRGQDEGDSEKWNRLLNEKKRLYQIHPEFLKRDPYYSRNLIGNDSNYLSNCDFGYNNHVKCDVVRQIDASELAKKDGERLRLSLDFAGIQSKLTLEEPEIIEIRGWSFIPGEDNALHGVNVILNNETTGIVYRVKSSSVPRKDVEEVFPGEINNRLSGFCTRILKDDLAEGEYRVGVEPTMLKEDLIGAESSGIVVYTDSVLTI